MKQHTVPIAVLLFTLFMMTGVMISGNQNCKEENKQEKPGLKVTIMVFSGRPNPTFTITDPDVIDKITQIVSGLPQNLQGSPATRPTLGYCGIRVENFSEKLPKLQSFSVYQSNVRLTNKGVQGKPGMEELRADTNLELQRFLIDYARKEGIIDQKTHDYLKTKTNR
ncbi:MAG: hypothetical protein ACM3SY_03635 [Candidatus Omnitrophota bacterium]